MNDRVTYGPSNRARAKVRKIFKVCLPFLLVPVTTAIPIADVVAMLEDVDDFIRLPKRAYRSV